MARFLVLVLLALPLLATACSTAVSRSAEAPAFSQAGQPGALALRAEPASADTARTAAAGGSTASNTSASRSTAAADAAIPPLDRMVIANVNLSLAVDNAIDGARLAERIAERYSGFVAGSNIRDNDGGREASLTIRVPSSRLSEALSDLRGVGRRVTDESRTTQDVTEEYTDVDSNIRNLRATEAQILALMERATKVEEVLTLQRELTGIRGQIERLEGRRRVLENRSDFATIAMKLVEPITAPRPDGWNPTETVALAVAALGRFAERLGTAVIWLLVFIPVYGPIVVAGRWLARRRRTTTPPAAASQA
jgi:Domain of unknown function (DUF4349)